MESRADPIVTSGDPSGGGANGLGVKRTAQKSAIFLCGLAARIVDWRLASWIGDSHPCLCAFVCLIVPSSNVDALPSEESSVNRPHPWSEQCQSHAEGSQQYLGPRISRLREELPQFEHAH